MYAVNDTPVISILYIIYMSVTIKTTCRELPKVLIINQMTITSQDDKFVSVGRFPHVP